jgi:hypothetical protein
MRMPRAATDRQEPRRHLLVPIQLDDDCASVNGPATQEKTVSVYYLEPRRPRDKIELAVEHHTRPCNGP